MINLSSNYPSAAGQDEVVRRYMKEVLTDSAVVADGIRRLAGLFAQ